MWTSIDAYARRHRLRDDRFDRLLFLLRQMDRAYLGARAAPPIKEKKPR